MSIADCGSSIADWQIADSRLSNHGMSIDGTAISNQSAILNPSIRQSAIDDRQSAISVLYQSNLL